MHHYFIENNSLFDFGSCEFELAFAKCDMCHIKAQRIKLNEKISAVDKCGHRFIVEITDINKGSFKARILKEIPSHENNFSYTLLFALSKSSKVEDVIRASTEIGFDDFYIFKSQRSVISLDKKKEGEKCKRYQSIARSASMQSCRSTIPHVHEILNLNELECQIAQLDAVLFCYEGAKLNQQILKVVSNIYTSGLTSGKIGIIVGPEGGFSADEVDQLRGFNNIHEVSLGETILRCETAGIVASSLAKSAFDTLSEGMLD